MYVLGGSTFQYSFVPHFRLYKFSYYFSTKILVKELLHGCKIKFYPKIQEASELFIQNELFLRKTKKELLLMDEIIILCS